MSQWKNDSRDSIRTISSIGVRRSTTDQAKIKNPSVFVSAGGKGVKSLRKTPWPKNTIANSSNWVNGQLWKNERRKTKNQQLLLKNKNNKKEAGKRTMHWNFQPKIDSYVCIHNKNNKKRNNTCTLQIFTSNMIYDVYIYCETDQNQYKSHTEVYHNHSGQ